MKHLKSRGLRIDGVGLQLHGSLTHPSADGLEYAITSLAAAGVKLKEGEADQRLTELRRMYEPYVHALASYFHVSVPPWVAGENWVDNWQASSSERRIFSKEPAEKAKGEHF